MAALGFMLATPVLAPTAASAASLTVSTPCVVPSAPKVDFALAAYKRQQGVYLEMYLYSPKVKTKKKKKK